MSDSPPRQRLQWSQRPISTGLRQLADRVERGGSPADWEPIDALDVCGGRALKPLVRLAGSTGEWDDAVAHFGSGVGERDLVYLGLMRSHDQGGIGAGLLVGTRDPIGAEAFEAVSAAAPLLGERLFGRPCEFHGRIVEFYDVDLVAGPLRSARPAPIALFSPFYLAGWTDRERQFKTRRTIMFSNVVATRFMRATRPAAASSGILIDGQPPAILDATDVELKQAIGQWLSLHELMHGSGPAPFFAKWTGKSRLGKEYGVIEEMRVEMTSFVAAGLLDIHQGRIVQEMILMERLFRCARRGLGRRRRGEAVELDDAHGLAWLGALSDVAIRADSGKIRVDMAGVERTIGQVLATVYAIEQEAATADDAASVLSEHGRRLQSELLPGARSATRLVVAIAALDHPDAISLEGVEA